LALAGSSRAAAQDPSDEDIKLFRKDLRSLRKQIIAANINLSDKEAEQFWPLFDRYTQELVAKQDRKYALIKELRRRLHNNDTSRRRTMSSAERMLTRRSGKYG